MTASTAKKLDRPDTAPEKVEVKENEEEVDALLTTREVAEALKTDPRTLRKFLRDDSTIENAGKGNRYEFRPDQLKSLRKGFAAWGKSHATSDAPKSNTPKLDALAREELEGMTVKELRELAPFEIAAKTKKADIIDRLLA